VAAVDGTGIAELTNCLSAVRKNHQDAAIIGLSENFKEIFEMVGVAGLATLYDSEADALIAMQKTKGR
jgi:anti-anti-sigma regulatory factor